MTGEARDLLMNIEEENEWLENELASPSLGRMTEYAIARESGDPTLRRIGWIAERLHLSVAEPAGDHAALRRFNRGRSFARVGRDPRERSDRQPLGLDLQVDRLAPGELAQNSRQVRKARISSRPEHAHQILRVDRHSFAELIEADGGVDVIPINVLPVSMSPAAKASTGSPKRAARNAGSRAARAFIVS